MEKAAMNPRLDERSSSRVIVTLTRRKRSNCHRTGRHRKGRPLTVSLRWRSHATKTPWPADDMLKSTGCPPPQVWKNNALASCCSHAGADLCIGLHGCLAGQMACDRARIRRACRLRCPISEPEVLREVSPKGMVCQDAEAQSP
jgi:hypothetical protein